MLIILLAFLAITEIHLYAFGIGQRQRDLSYEILQFSIQTKSFIPQSIGSFLEWMNCQQSHLFINFFFILE